MADKKSKQKAEFTVEEICNGFKYADYEPSELPETCEDLVGKWLDRYDDRYWRIVDDFWNELRDEAAKTKVQQLYEKVPDARSIIERGLAAMKKEGDETSSSGSESSEKPKKKGGKAKKGGKPKKGAEAKQEKQEKSETVNTNSAGSGSASVSPAAAALGVAPVATASAPTSTDIGGGARKKGKKKTDSR